MNRRRERRKGLTSGKLGGLSYGDRLRGKLVLMEAKSCVTIPKIDPALSRGGPISDIVAESI